MISNIYVRILVLYYTLPLSGLHSNPDKGIYLEVIAEIKC